jgi:ElaA protein
MELHWVYKSFEELTVPELYAILQLRNEVFVVEQNCPYQDADNKDICSYHLAGWDAEKIVAYARIIPPGVAFENASIGRVVSAPLYRGKNAGNLLMINAIEKTLSQFNVRRITIGAQLYLKLFYEKLGFVQCSQEYLEDNIPHIEMLFVK